MVNLRAVKGQPVTPTDVVEALEAETLRVGVTTQTVAMGTASCLNLTTPISTPGVTLLGAGLVGLLRRRRTLA